MTIDTLPEPSRGVVWTAHRGGALEPPENSTAALSKAYASGTAQVLDVDVRMLRDEDLRRALRSGVPRVWAHTVNTPTDRDRALRLGCDGVITDAPERLGPTGGGRARAGRG